MALLIVLIIVLGFAAVGLYASPFKGWSIVCIIALVALIFFSWNSQSAQKTRKHMESGITGLTRIVELKDYNGKVLEHFEGTMQIETIPGGVSFIDDKGKEIKLIGGIITVKEK